MTLISRKLFSKNSEMNRVQLLFFPLVGSCLTNYLYIFLEKIFLSRVSQHALEAAINITFVCQIFQMASLAIAMMAQVSIGRWFGSRRFDQIGPGTWQYIWFSFLSMIVTVPVCLAYGYWYFLGSEIEQVATTYFYVLTFSNFLFPLYAALSSYFLGQGRTRLILFANLGEQIVKIALGYVLIFGLDPWIPSLGILGGIISSLSVHLLLCIFLGAFVLRKKERKLFHTNQWKFRFDLFWNCIQPGIFRAFNRIFNVLSWGAIAHLMVSRGGDYLLILSLGGSFSLFLPFLFEAIYQAETIVLSQHIGEKRHDLLSKTVRSGFLLVAVSIVLTSSPFLIYAKQLFPCFFPLVSLDPISISLLFLGVWIWFAYFTLSAIPISYILAFKDTRFYSILGGITCVTDYLLMYFFIEKMQMNANLFWVVLSLVQMMGTIPFYFWRMKILSRRQFQPAL